MAFSPTESDVAYHWPLSSMTEREPGTVSSESSSWVTLGFADRNEDRASDALTYAWRRMAVSRSRRMNWRAVKYVSPPMVAHRANAPSPKVTVTRERRPRLDQGRARGVALDATSPASSLRRVRNPRIA